MDDVGYTADATKLGSIGVIWIEAGVWEQFLG
jgi:hypothetical protein